MGEGHPAPQGTDPLQENPLAGGGGPGEQQGGRLLPQGDPAGCQGGQAHHAGADEDAHDSQQRINLEPEGGQVKDGGIGKPDDRRQAVEAQQHACDAAQQPGGDAVDHILGCNLMAAVAQGLEGAHLGAVFLHHPGHGGAGHQGRHQEEEQGEYPGDGFDPVGVLLEHHHRNHAVPIQHIPLAGGDVVHLLGGVVQLLAGIGQLSLGVGLLPGKFGGALVVGIPAFVQLGPGVFQLFFSGVKGGPGLGVAGVEGQLAFQHLELHPLQGGLSLGDQLLVGEVGGRDQPLLVHLLLALVQLGLVVRQLLVGGIVEGLGPGQQIPELHIVHIIRLGLFQGSLGILEDILGVAQHGVGYALEGDQLLDLLQLLLKVQHLGLGIHQLVGAAGHGVGQGGLLGLQLLQAAGVFGLALIQFGFGLVQLLLGVGQLGLGLGLLLFKGGAGLIQLGLGRVNEVIPPLGRLPGADGFQAVLDGVHRLPILVGIVVVLIGARHLDVAGGVVIHGQAAVRHIDGHPQGAVAGCGALGLIGKVEGIFHKPHHRQGVGVQPCVAGEGDGIPQPDAGSGGGVQHLDHALAGCLGHPAIFQNQAVHVGCFSQGGVGGQLLDPDGQGVAAPVAALAVHRFDRHDGLHPFDGRDGVDVLAAEAQGGHHPDVKDILLGVPGLACTPHAGGNAEQAGEHHDPQQHNPEYRGEAAFAGRKFPPHIFAIGLFHDDSPLDLFHRDRVLVHLIGDDLAAAHLDDPVGHTGQSCVVGDDNDGAAGFPAGVLQEGQNRLAGLVVQSAGRLVTQKDLGVFGQGAGNGYPLLFAAGQLGREVVEPLAQAHAFQSLGGVQGIAADLDGQLHIFQGGQILHQVVKLEHKAHIVAPVGGELFFVEAADLGAVQDDASFVAAVHPPQHVQQGGFAGAGRPDDDTEFPLVDMKGHVICCSDPDIAGLVVF